MYESLTSPEQRANSPVAEIPAEPMAAQSVVASGETAEQTYAPEYVAMLLVNSFRFSQGMVGTQKTIIHYLAEQFNENFDKDAIKESAPIAGKTIYAIVNNPAVHPRTRRAAEMLIPIEVSEEEAERQANTYADELITNLNNKGRCPVDTIMDAVITRDLKKLRVNDSSKPTGRTRQDTKGRSPFTDPYFSNWVYFGLMGQTTGMPEYDRMFEDMVKVFERPGVDRLGRKVSPIVRGKSAELIKFYLEHHPEQIDLLPGAYRPDLLEQATA